MGGVVKDWFNIQASFLGMGALTFVGFMLCLIFLPTETMTEKNGPPGSRGSVPYMKLIKDPLGLFTFHIPACFTTCIGIIWAFLPLLASTKMALSSSAIGIVVMINVLYSRASTGTDGISR